MLLQMQGSAALPASSTRVACKRTCSPGACKDPITTAGFAHLQLHHKCHNKHQQPGWVSVPDVAAVPVLLLLLLLLPVLVPACPPPLEQAVHWRRQLHKLALQMLCCVFVAVVVQNSLGAARWCCD